jgi:hypothetical protein
MEQDPDSGKMNHIRASHSQQSHRRREAVDCFNCSASRRHCDRTRHRCNTCSKGSEICQGYPRELQWLAGVTSRGKRKGQSISIKASNREWESTTPTNYAFIFKQARSPRRRSQVAKCLTATTSRPITSPGCGTPGDGSPPSGSDNHASPELLPYVTSVSGSGSSDIQDLAHNSNAFECLDNIDSIFDPSVVSSQTLSEMFRPLPSDDTWLAQPVAATTVPHNVYPQLFPLPLYISDSGPSDLLTLCES